MKYKAFIKRVMSIIEYIIIITLIAVLVLVIYSNIQNKPLEICGIKTFVIISRSMEPTINVGDVIITQNEDNINIGDIVAYRQNSVVVVHRVIGIENNDGKNMYITKGDLNNSSDIRTVKNTQIEGVCKKIIPKIGLIKIFITQNLISVAITVFLLVILVVSIKYVVKK